MCSNLLASSCRSRCFGLIVAAFLLPGSSFAQSPTTPTITAGKLDASAEGPAIDGRVNDQVWQSVAPYTTFTQQDPIEGAPASERTEVRVIVGKGNVYVGIIAFDSDPSKIIVSQSRRDASLTETDSVVMVFDTFNDNQNAFVFGTNPLGIEYDGQVAREGQTQRRLDRWRRRRRHAARRHQRLQSELGRRLDGAKPDHRARLGDGNVHPPQDAALPDGRQPDLGLQRAPEYPSQERAGLPRADSARLRHLSRVAGGKDERPATAGAPRHQADPVRSRLGEQGLRARRRAARRQLRFRRRPQVGNPSQPDARRHRTTPTSPRSKPTKSRST